jgi:hypothetical protein
VPRFIISVDRVGGLSIWSVTQTPPAPATERTDSGTSLAFLTGTTSPNAFPATIYQTPRLAFDYALPSHLTIGGAVGLFAGSDTRKSGGVSQDGPSLSMYDLSPRVGFFLPISERIAFWPRGGLSIFGFSSTSKDATGVSTTVTDTGISADLEAVLVIRPTSNTGLTVAGIGDIGLSGKEEQSGGPPGSTSQSIDGTASNFGIALGVFAGF